MPELPEVAILARTLCPRLCGQKILRVKVLAPHSIERPLAKTFARFLQGRTVLGVSRRGKYLVLHLSGGQILLCHLRMTGRFYIVLAHESTFPKYSRVLLHTRRFTLVFSDPRKLGRMSVLSQEAAERILAKLGVEPLSSSFTTTFFSQCLSGTRAPLKNFLLDQRRVAGLGNIYASEALFRARLAPWRRGVDLDAAEIRRLHKAIIETLNKALRVGSSITPIAVFTKEPHHKIFYFGSDKKKLVREMFFVYDRENKPCRRCRTPIRRITQAGRSTYYCPCCQGGDGA